MSPVTYNGTSVTFGSIVSVATNIESDGLLFLPNGNLLTAEGDVTEVNPITGQTQTFSSGPGGDHLALDPSGQYAWTSDQPGELEKIPLNPFSPPVAEPLTGDDTQVTAIAFDPSGNAYYTTGSPTGAGNFGTINLQTFTTTRVFSDLPAARGMMYDPFTGDIILVGLSDVTQIDPKTMTIVSTRDFSSLGISRLDQGAVDGQGHLYVADNTGKLLFVDYSQTGLIGDSSDFVSAQDFAYHLDDVAPLAGLGGSVTSFSVAHTLPSTGYTVDPTSITPTASSVSSSEIDWMGSLPDSSTGSEDFQVSGSVAGMAPGEVRQISDGTTVTVTFMSNSGQLQEVPIALAPVTVAAEHIISLLPDSQTADLGSETSYTVQLTNPYSTPVTYNLATEGLDGFTVGLASSVTVPAGQTVTTPLDLAIPLTSAAVTTGFEVLASTASGVSDSVEGELTVMSQVELADARRVARPRAGTSRMRSGRLGAIPGHRHERRQRRGHLRTRHRRSALGSHGHIRPEHDRRAPGRDQRPHGHVDPDHAERNHPGRHPLHFDGHLSGRFRGHRLGRRHAHGDLRLDSVFSQFHIDVRGHAPAARQEDPAVWLPCHAHDLGADVHRAARHGHCSERQELQAGRRPRQPDRYQASGL